MKTKSTKQIVDDYFNGNMWNEYRFSSKSDEKKSRETQERDALTESYREEQE